jgi:hypothetical protein
MPLVGPGVFVSYDGIQVDYVSTNVLASDRLSGWISLPTFCKSPRDAAGAYQE